MTTPTLVLREAIAPRAVALFALVLAGCATGPADGGAAGAPPPGHARVHTVILGRGEQAVIAVEQLTVALVEIDDSRCPVQVSCVWAGHATVTLQASKTGQAPATFSIGSQAPAGMGLPYEATYAGHLFHLLALESGAAAPVPRATIRISPLLPGPAVPDSDAQTSTWIPHSRLRPK